MDKLSMCRICLIEDVKMYSLINTKLQKMYEKLTKMPFVAKDIKPLQVCYICCARLHNCHRLQATCLKSEEFFNKLMEEELKQMELPNLNTFRTVHPLTVMSCVPSKSKDPGDDKIDRDYDPLEITFDVQVKDESFEGGTFINKAADIQSEGSIDDEDICTEDADMSDNSHTIQDSEVKNDIHLKTVEIVLERIDLKQFKIGAFAAKKPKLSVQNRNNEVNILTKPETEVTAIENKNIVKAISFTDKHIKKNTDVYNKKKPYKCKVCEKTFSAQTTLLRHTCIHTGENLYICNICGKSFMEKSILAFHIRIHTEEGPYICTVCEKSFVRKKGLVTHTRIHPGHRPYRCTVCEKSFVQKKDLVTHTRIHTGERPYRCNVCGKCYRGQYSLLYHTLNHTGEKPYRCNICGQSYTRKRGLVIHTRIHTGERPYSCNVCEKSFAVKSVLMNHIRIHTGEKPHRCNICKRSFIKKFDLVKHTRIHTGERPYRCDICEKSFVLKATLSNHTRRHTGERPFRCDICDRRFARKYSLVKHIHIHMKKPLKSVM